jgi:hypothetical protein
MAGLKESLAELILAFVVLIVGLSLTPSVATAVATAAATAGIVNTAAATLIVLVDLFWVIMLAMIPIVVVVRMVQEF